MSNITARYTEEHEWVTFDPATKVGTIGITDYAQKALGDVVFVELPAEGTEVEAGGESGRRAQRPSVVTLATGWRLFFQPECRVIDRTVHAERLPAASTDSAESFRHPRRS